MSSGFTLFIVTWVANNVSDTLCHVMVVPDCNYNLIVITCTQNVVIGIFHLLHMLSVAGSRETIWTTTLKDGDRM